MKKCLFHSQEDLSFLVKKNVFIDYTKHYMAWNRNLELGMVILTHIFNQKGFAGVLQNTLSIRKVGRLEIKLWYVFMLMTFFVLVMIEEFIKDMTIMFEMNDLGMLNYFLGMEIKQDESGIFMTQKICWRPIEIVWNDIM